MADYPEVENKMKKTCEALTTQLATIRAGRANAAVLDQIQVDYYGSPTPIQQLATIATPDPRSLLIQPWDASVLKGIERAILASDLGINPHMLQQSAEEAAHRCILRRFIHRFGRGFHFRFFRLYCLISGFCSCRHLC